MKTTYFLFKSQEAQDVAKNDLVAFNIPFKANLTYPFFVAVTAKRAVKYDLDLRLCADNCLSTRF